MKTTFAKQRGLNITRLMARDGTDCTICDRPLNRKIKGTDPEAVSFDHIETQSAGGLSALSNLRLAHVACNQRRGNGIA